MNQLKQQFQTIASVYDELASEGSDYIFPETTEDAMDFAVSEAIELRMERRGLSKKYLRANEHEAAEMKAADLYQMVIVAQLARSKELGSQPDFESVEYLLSSDDHERFTDKSLLQITMDLCRYSLNGGLTMQYTVFAVRILRQMYPNLAEILVLRLAYRVYTNGVCYQGKPLSRWYESVGNRTHPDIVDYIAKWDTPERLNGAMSRFLKTV